MTHLPILPEGFAWDDRKLVLKAEGEEGVPLCVVVANPKTFEQFDALVAFIEASGEMYRQRGYDTGHHRGYIEGLRFYDGIVNTKNGESR